MFLVHAFLLDTVLKCTKVDFFSDKGKVFVFGSGFSGQLGSGVSVLESVVPSSLELPFTVTQVECGENFTALVSGIGFAFIVYSLDGKVWIGVRVVIMVGSFNKRCCSVLDLMGLV